MTTPITIVLTAALWALPQLGLTQVYKNEKVVYLDADGNSTKEKRAVSLEQIIPFGDTAWQINLYRMYGPRIKSFWCSDPAVRSFKKWRSNRVSLAARQDG
jgi:hypothetical protein